MANSINRLSDRSVRAKTLKGLYADGGGLYLQCTAGKSKSWIFRFKRDGKVRDMGLGGWPTVSLADAREKATEARRLHGQGKDPIEQRDAQMAQARIEAARAITFKTCAEKLIESHEGTWRNEKHRQQWRNTLETYAYPVVGKLPVADVDTTLVLKILEPIWRKKPETASRVRGRVERVLSWAKARGYRQGENPAQWRGHLDQILPVRSKVRAVVHHPALPYPNLPAFMGKLRWRDGVTPLALEFTILTAVRTNEARGAKFAEIDLEAKLWTIPAERMKGNREHRIPLSDRAVAIVKEMQAVRINTYLFPGLKTKKPLSDMSLLMMVREIAPGITVHGFRSTFKDWANETTAFPDFLSEMALAHISGDKVRDAYARAELVEKRRELMDAWAEYCHSACGALKRKRPPPRKPTTPASSAKTALLPIRQPIPGALVDA